MKIIKYYLNMKKKAIRNTQNIEQGIPNFPKGYLFTPKRMAMDYNDFTKKFIIKGLINKNIRTILFKKKDDADT